MTNKIHVTDAGYDIKSINTVLEEYHRTFEAFKIELEKKEIEIGRKDAEIYKLNNMSNTMYRELAVYRDNNKRIKEDTERAIADAKKEAEAIICEAKNNASEIIDSAMSSADQILSELKLIAEVNKKAKLHMQMQIGEVLNLIDSLDEIPTHEVSEEIVEYLQDK